MELFSTKYNKSVFRSFEKTFLTNKINAGRGVRRASGLAQQKQPKSIRVSKALGKSPQPEPRMPPCLRYNQLIFNRFRAGRSGPQSAAGTCEDAGFTLQFREILSDRASRVIKKSRKITQKQKS